MNSIEFFNRYDVRSLLGSLSSCCHLLLLLLLLLLLAGIVRSETVRDGQTVSLQPVRIPQGWIIEPLV